MKLKDITVEIEAYGRFYLEEGEPIETLIEEIEDLNSGIAVTAYQDRGRGRLRNYIEAILYIRGTVGDLRSFIDKHITDLYDDRVDVLLANAKVII